MSTPSQHVQPSEVLPGLWVSGIDGLLCLQTLQITHILSVVNGAIDQHPHHSDLACLHIDVMDSEDANILQFFPSSAEFIAKALHSTAELGKPKSPRGRVLVHCAQGTSRSITIVAAYLMTTHPEYDPEAALAHILRVHPSAAPNDGFMRQLHVYYCMGCKFDPTYVPYRRLLAEQMAQQYQETGELNVAMLSAPENGASRGATSSYRCRTCRTVLATSDNVLERDDSSQSTNKGFGWRKRGSGPVTPESENRGGGIFVEPLRWMSSIAGGAIQGKIHCPKCSARLGSFNWAGLQRHDGVWVTPGFQLHIGRLDIESTPSTLDEMQWQLKRLTIRQPKLLGRSSMGQTVDIALAVTTSPQLEGAQRATVTCRFDVLILDCDGVMVDSERPSCESLRQAIHTVLGVDIPHQFPQDYRPVFGMDVRSCVEYYMQKYPLFSTETSFVDEVVRQVTVEKERVYKELTASGVAPFPGIKPLVDSARRMGLQVAVASSGNPEKIRHNLETAGLLGLVPPELIVSTAYVARGKPAPDVYIETLRRMKCEDAPEKAVVIEDSVNGLISARDAGCFTLGVTTSMPAEDLRAYADVVVDRLEDICLKEL